MTTKIEHLPDTKQLSRTVKRLLLVAPLAMVGSAVANLALYVVAGRLFPAVTAWPGAGAGQIIGASFAYLFFGAVVCALIARFSTRPTHHYWLVATIGLLLSLGLPISAGFGNGAPGAPPAGAETVFTLSLMHLIAYVISVPMFTRMVLDRTP